MNLGERLLILRRRKHISQKDIAAAHNISMRTYQYYERNEREPTVSVLISLADYFDVSIDYLVGRTDNPEVNK